VALPSGTDIQQIFNQDYWRSVAADTTSAAILALAGLMAALAVSIVRAVTPHAVSILRSTALFVEIALFLFCGLLALRITIANVTPPTAVLQQQQMAYLWAPLTDPQKNAIADAVYSLGPHRVEIWRPDTSDCDILAGGLAGILQQNGWELVEPPYSPIGFQGTGLTLFVRPSENEKTDHLKATLSKELGVDVERQPLNEAYRAPMVSRSI
jgi:hypothetical protein